MDNPSPFASPFDPNSQFSNMFGGSGAPPSAPPQQPQQQPQNPMQPPQDPRLDLNAATDAVASGNLTAFGGMDPTSLKMTIERAMNEDATKDPAYKEFLKDYKDSMTLFKDHMAAANKEAGGTMPPVPSAPHQEEKAPNLHEFAINSTPFIVSMMALGGRAMKLSGGNMLGAMNGMMKGIQTGQQKMYEESYKRWQDNYTRLRQDWQDQMEIWKANMEMRKGRIDAELQAANAAAAYAGMADSGMKNVVGAHNAKEKAMIALSAQSSAMQRFHEAQTAKIGNLRLKAEAQLQKFGQGFSRISTAKDLTNEAYKMLPRLLQAYKSQNTDPSTGRVVQTPQSWSAFINQYASVDPDAVRFQRIMTTLKPILVGIELPSGSRGGNMFLHKLISDQVPDFLAMNPQQISVSMSADKRVMDQAYDLAKGYVDMATSSAKAYGSDTLPDFDKSYKIDDLSAPNGKPGKSPADSVDTSNPLLN